ncbi:unnamed protein product [Rhizoctonia solani]|uniref:Laminin domain protein n=1 Tax=Rhizoctonia solani TaxID=456999 RepID=A0A8H3BQ10_9AGAM|nr:unnamed protein product [Rhizoctonia solani]
MPFHLGDAALTPPQLPAYLSTFDLKPIVGKPTDEEVKAVHAAIRALNGVAHIPVLYDPNLSMQLSQHLFNVQLAVYREEYSIKLLPSDKSTFTPPNLPSHIPGTLSKVIGAPSNDELKNVQSTLRNVENLAYNPQLFDADLSIKLSQHLFNLQFARYMQESAQGSFAPKVDSKEPHSAVLQASSAPCGVDPRSEDRNNVGALQPERVTPPEIAQLGEVMKEMKEAIEGSTDVLRHMDKVLVSTQRSMSTVTVGAFSYSNHVHKNPINCQGELATEHGLPQLRFYFYKGAYHILLSSEEIAGYLKFLNVGVDLLQHGKLELKTNKEDEAKKLLMKHIGIGYINP